jgi:TNFR/NGFR cysteine-rich region
MRALITLIVGMFFVSKCRALDYTMSTYVCDGVISNAKCSAPGGYNPNSWSRLSYAEGAQHSCSYPNYCMRCDWVNTCNPVIANAYYTTGCAWSCNSGFSLTNGACVMPCATGYYASSGNCFPCPNGMYSLGGTSTNCLACTNTAANGYYTGLGTNSTSCPIACNGGYYLSSGSCSVCPNGQYSLAGSSACTACSAGQYQGQTGQTSCANCSVCGGGYYSSSVCNATTNTSCSACTVCSAGSYQVSVCNTTTNAVCQACPINSSSAPGAVSVDQCGCNPGFSGNLSVVSGVCTPCGAGSYQYYQCGVALGNYSKCAYNISMCASCASGKCVCSIRRVGVYM